MKKIIVFLVVLLLGIFTSCKNSLSGKITIADGKEPFTLNQDMVSRLAALAVTGDCKLDEQQVKDNVLSALSALSENSNERAAVTVTDFSLSAPKVATLKAPASFGKTERSANIQDFDEINLYLYTTNEGKDNEGWILASNDRRVGTIIAVVDGKYSEDDEEENPFMDIFYAGLENHILETVYTWNSLTEEDIRAALTNTEIAESDDYYYNNWYIRDKKLLRMYKYCWNHEASPFRSFIANIYGGEYAAGCGPVALGQIFALYAWPERCTTVQLAYLKQKCDDKKLNNWDGVYDWELLQRGYIMPFEDSSDECQYEIKGERIAFRVNASALMYDIGINCNATYTPDATTVSSAGIKKALKHFGYLFDEEKKYDLKDIKQSIKNGYPVYINGGHRYNKIGHAWVISGFANLSCDVYKKAGNVYITRLTDNFVYCNSGMGAGYNGYYLNGIFDLGRQMVDIYNMKEADADWYIREKIRLHERAERPNPGQYYYRVSVQIITNIRPSY